MAFMITGGSGLPAYEKDPVAVSAMREACHHNLYAIANSQAMNGIGADTTIKSVTPKIIVACKIGAVVFWVIFAGSLVLWIMKKKQFKKTEAYTNYMASKKKSK